MSHDQMIPMLALLVTVSASAQELSFTDARTGQAVAGVVVSSPAAIAAVPGHVEMAQRDRAFDPHYLVISRGSQVDFPNYDPIMHHVYSFSKARVFNLELYRDRPQAPVSFDRAGIVEVGCNIHDHMKGFIVVMDGREWLLSDADGRVSLPDSWHQAQVIEYWHPQLRENNRMHEAEIKATSIPLTIALDLKMAEASTSRLDALQKKFKGLRSK